MLLKQNNPKVVKSILFTGLLALLASCGNSSAIESMIRADPQLREEAIDSQLETATNSLDTNTTVTNNTSTDDSQVSEDLSQDDKTAINDIPEEEVLLEDDALKPTPQRSRNTTEDVTDLPANFPASFPIYPQVNLKEAKVGEDEVSGMLTWTSKDNSKAIADYYQAELNSNDWKVIKPFRFDEKGDLARAIAVKDNHKVHLTLLRSQNKETGNNGTKLSAIYEPIEPLVATDTSTTDSSEADSSLKPEQQNAEIDSSSDNAPENVEDTNEEVVLFPEVVQQKQNDLATETVPSNDYFPDNASDFDDIDNSVSEPLIEPLETVAALGILSPYTQEGNTEVSRFAPNAIITRGEYARWLIAANNRYHEGDPGKKIHVASSTEDLAFQDIKTDHPDFGAIQGLAEAGLVPSRLTQDSTKLLFRPDAPLTREDLLTWKVPLDTRQALPKASIEAIEESWGFQDAANIDSTAVRALYADYQNGDRSNVRRIFGFTTLFQGKKPVTRAEAAASLWYFGFQGDGITAQEILESETDTESNS